MARRTRRGALDRGRLPRHIGIIMDGNGRWATARGLERSRGHRAGSRAVRAVVRACRRLGVPVLTLFAFSTENWGRPRREVQALMELLSEFIAREWQEIMRREIRVVHLGDLRRVPGEVRRQLLSLERATRHHRRMTLALALSYGSREEMARACRRLAARAAAGRLRPAAIGIDEVSAALDTRGLPDPDLIIRTGGELRLSNFLLWQGAYAELFFSKRLWPDFTESDLRAAIADFQSRRRRFGLTDEQAEERERA
ncbi:MAG: di-trans,poly-cis-decaprenylcistransferase [Myxococcales bacterium]|nr:di-trans,poly-cis-decaprenylcistransferase [Myxococcales bacterium]